MSHSSSYELTPKGKFHYGYVHVQDELKTGEYSYGFGYVTNTMFDFVHYIVHTAETAKIVEGRGKSYTYMHVCELPKSREQIYSLPVQDKSMLRNREEQKV